MAGEKSAQKQLFRSNTSPSSPSAGGAEMRRTTSALARFTRSVTKLRSHRRRGSDIPSIEPLNEEEETVMQRSQTAPSVALQQRQFRRSDTMPAGVTGLQIKSSGPDSSVFLRSVPDMLAVDSSIASVSAAIRNAETLARSLRASAVEMEASGGDNKGGAVSSEGIDDRNWIIQVDAMHAALAEHRFETAVEHWQCLESIAAEETSEKAWALGREADECRLKLVSALQQRILLDGINKSDQHAVVLLESVAGTAIALNTVLYAASAHLKVQLEALPMQYQRTAAPGSSAAAESASLEFAASIGQTTAQGIIYTYETIAKILPNATLQCQWVFHEIKLACEVLRKTVVLPRAAPAGLPTTARCAAVFLAFMDDIDSALSVSVSQYAREAVWVGIDPVLQRRVRQLCEGLAKAAGAEAKAAAAGVPVAVNGAAWEVLVDSFPSAARLLTEVQVMASALAPIAGPSAVTGIRTSITAVFLAFAQAITGSFADTSAGTHSVDAAEVAMEVATRLVEHHVSQSTAAMSNVGWGSAVDAMAMLGALEGMASALGMGTVPLSPGPVV